MNYPLAKIYLLRNAPLVPFKLYAIEAAALISIAAILVKFFA